MRYGRIILLRSVSHLSEVLDAFKRMFVVRKRIAA